MHYDLVIRNGMLVDGSGGPRFPADIAVHGGRIVKIGRVRAPATRTIDADGLVVAPGFVDGHTHMDAQVFWDPLGSCSCYHGVTTVIMGNCGFTLAPCAEKDADFVFRNLERAEDLSRDAMRAGIKWQWETFREYLAAVDALPKGINYGGYIGHSPLRTFVMGERAFTEQASADDLARMCHEVQDAVRAGAIGFSTSRTMNHLTSDDRPVASRVADWDEVRAIVMAMGETGAGIFELASEEPGRSPRRQRDYFDRLKHLAVDSGCPVTFGMPSIRIAPELWPAYYDLGDEVAAAGGRLFVQAHSREISTLLSFKSHTPFDNWELWREVRAKPLDEQKVLFGDPAMKRRLVDIASRPYEGPKVVGAEARPPEWEWVYHFNGIRDQRRMSDIAAERGVAPVEAMIDLAVERDFDCFFRQPLANEDQDAVLKMMKHPRSVVTFSDSGAHVAQIMDSSLQTHLLSHWVRDREAFTLEQAVRMITQDTAVAWGLYDRGLLREGLNADIVVFDPDTIDQDMPELVNDLPAGAQRLKQTSRGIHYTIVNGEVLLEDNKPTGATPGRLVRGPLAREQVA
ncbi:MAG: amidohydrolase family protein [Gammaproteobacteria bacterium]|nr:amidohydrolase family protein [Gammaproteobacteria bacterium]MCP5199871.1 amidohydrolase family protein [Gammaproteobacteria bacterium]